jgi:hypothetical protein
MKLTDSSSSLDSYRLKIKNMKHLLILSIMLVIDLPIALSQDSREDEIRHLENLERVSVLKFDSATLFGKIWSPKMVINTPANVVGTVEGTKTQLRSGNLNYLSFERNIEKITFYDNVAIVMGGEKVKPQGKQMNAGKLVSRRFTNVWMYSNNTWRIIARQATIIKVE